MRTTSVKNIYLKEYELKQAIVEHLEKTEPELAQHLYDNSCSMACVRATASGHLGRLRNKLVMVVEYPDKLPRAAKGAKPVVILPVGSTQLIETEERWLKRASV